MDKNYYVRNNYKPETSLCEVYSRWCNVEIGYDLNKEFLNKLYDFCEENNRMDIYNQEEEKYMNQLKKNPAGTWEAIGLHFGNTDWQFEYDEQFGDMTIKEAYEKCKKSKEHDITDFLSMDTECRTPIRMAIWGYEETLRKKNKK